ncbi:MAG TPA: GNAT family N-acetyltransferase [Candidatus Limnocylindrales bacterium]|nr:GNAT family N-acetyltransferase [Candidatus Limnocylindrales bacterium]
MSEPRTMAARSQPARAATEADRPAWDAFVAARAEADPLQAWAWGEANATEGRELPHRLVLARDDGSLAGVAQALVRGAGMGRSVVYVPHGPLWQREADDAPALLRALLDGLRTLAREQRALVVKLDPRAAPGGTTADELDALLAGEGLRRARHDLQARTTRLVDLRDGADELMATWHKDARNLVRRSAREGVETEVDRAAAGGAIEAFHAIWRATAERAEFRIRPLPFLATLAREAAASDGWYLVLARLAGRPIAGALGLRVGDRGHYLYGASLRAPELKHAHGPYACLAALMAALAADGVRTLDLWGVVEPGEPSPEPSWQGFSAFKRQFGGQPLRHPGTFDLVTDPVWFTLRDLRERLLGLLRR